MSSTLAAGGQILAPIQTEPMDRVFDLENERTLKIHLQDSWVWTRLGSMIAYEGQVKFRREGAFEHGLAKFFKRSLFNDGLMLSKAEGNGYLYLADQGKKIRILSIQNQGLTINGNDLLAFEESVSWDVKFLKSKAMLAGGLTHVSLDNYGLVAITTHFEPVTLKVTPDNPVCTDPNSTVAWSNTLQPKLKTDVSMKTFIGRGSGESLQLQFEGDGFVVVQPYEEIPAAAAQNRSGGGFSLLEFLF
jgi:uncharacterized protein (AIM24 family)